MNEKSRKKKSPIFRMHRRSTSSARRSDILATNPKNHESQRFVSMASPWTRIDMDLESDLDDLSPLRWPRLDPVLSSADVPRGACKAARLRSREIRKQRRCEVDREIRKRAAAESIGSRWLCDDWPMLTFIIKVVIGSPVIKLPPRKDFIKGLIIWLLF